jgi:tRNA (guanine-N7-)-methyltransferase
MKIIRSFANRSRNLKPKQQMLFDDAWKIYGLNQTNGEVNFAKVFANNLPIILEIGFGMGDNLLALAKDKPEYNYLGIDVYLPGAAKLITSLSEQNIPNVRVFHGDIVEILKVIPDESLAKILIFFPDPWPKRRHHKRRLIQTEFCKALVKKLQHGGMLYLATDWEDYAKHTLKVLEAISELQNNAGPHKFADRVDFRTLTKFEMRGQNLGHKIFDLAFKKL